MMLMWFQLFNEVLLASATCFVISYVYSSWKKTTKTDDDDDHDDDHDDDDDDDHDYHHDVEDDDDDDKPSRRSIYMIFHETYDGTNVVTLDWARIPIIVNLLTQKYNDPPSGGQWRYREIIEEEEFDADLYYGGHEDIIKVKTD
jgi:hypothetical protein